MAKTGESPGFSRGGVVKLRTLDVPYAAILRRLKITGQAGSGNWQSITTISQVRCVDCCAPFTTDF